VDVYGDCFGTPAPVVTEVGSLTAYTTIAGTPSANQTFTVSGANLTANLILNAPTDFEISLSSSIGFGSVLNLTPTSGSVAATVIYARYNPAIAGTSSGNITIASTSAVTQTVAVTGSSTTTGISNLAKNENISIYPNPSNGLVFVKTTAKFQDMFVNVTDINGRVLFFEKLNSNNEQIDLTNNAIGIYFINVVDANKNVISKQKVILRK
ncbi:MAG TPA: T9SS type A sorting domain-containing protein, partial [Bacteroidia bacterium]|nr:T9SS type A sorting domain-containing protein [Bacteroidia bacterium]